MRFWAQLNFRGWRSSSHGCRLVLRGSCATRWGGIDGPRATVRGASYVWQATRAAAAGLF